MANYLRLCVHFRELQGDLATPRRRLASFLGAVWRIRRGMGDRKVRLANARARGRGGRGDARGRLGLFAHRRWRYRRWG